jgi:hypothetical protein
MSVTQNRDFYLARYEQESAAAEDATAHCARVAHLELAFRYAVLAEHSNAPRDERRRSWLLQAANSSSPLKNT